MIMYIVYTSIYSTLNTLLIRQSNMSHFVFPLRKSAAIMHDDGVFPSSIYLW
jgi:hypothetical protein